MPAPAIAVFLSAVVGLAAAAPAPTPATPAAAAATLPAWLTVRQIGTAEDAAALYQRLLRESLTRSAQGNTTWLKARLESEESFRFDSDTMYAANADFTGPWRFFNPGNARWPSSAYRIVFPDAAHYAVVAEIDCDLAGTGCPELVAHLRQLPSPSPSPGVMADSTLYREWMQMVVHEPCTPRTTNMPPPRYPPEPDRQGIGGTVVLTLMANACGDPRDVTIHQSSGRRDLDRSAMVAARRWQLPAFANGLGTLVRVPVTFTPGPTTPAATPAPASPPGATVPRP